MAEHLPMIGRTAESGILTEITRVQGVSTWAAAILKGCGVRSGPQPPPGRRQPPAAGPRSLKSLPLCSHSIPATTTLLPPAGENDNNGPPMR